MPTLKEFNALKAKLKSAGSGSASIKVDVAKAFREIATELRAARVAGAYSIDAVEGVLAHLEAAAAELGS
jgi:hypothetical protein